MATAAIVPLLAYGVVSILSIRSGSQRTVILGNQDTARRVSEQIEQYVANSVRILRGIAVEMEDTGLAQWQQERGQRRRGLQPAGGEVVAVAKTRGTPLRRVLAVARLRDRKRLHVQKQRGLLVALEAPRRTARPRRAGPARPFLRLPRPGIRSAAGRPRSTPSQSREHR